MAPPRIAAAILAAGGGERYGGATHKLLAPLSGGTVIELALRTAIVSGVGPVAVVEGAVDLAEVVPPAVTRLRNPAWRDGLATSLRVAVEWADGLRCDALVVGLGDQPGVGATAWRAVARDPRPGMVAADFGDRPRPPVRLDRSVWALLPSDGDEGARALARRHPDLAHTVRVPGDPADIDTVEDLARWS